MNLWIWRYYGDNKWRVFAKTRDHEQVGNIVESFPLGTLYMISVGPIVTIRGAVA